MATVSVVIPAHNHAEFLGETLESVRGQTFEDWEVRVVDDGSTDDTSGLALSFAERDRRIHYYRQENKGLAAARNAGLARSAGRFIQFLDSDDLLHEEKLASQVHALEEEPGIAVVYSDYRPFDSKSGKPTARFSDRLLGDDPLGDFLFLWERGLSIPIHAALFRAELWPSRRAFDEELLAKEDWLMWVELALSGARFHYLAGDLALYRMHDRNMCLDHIRMITAFSQAAMKIAIRLPGDLADRFIAETARYVERFIRYHVEVGLEQSSMAEEIRRWLEEAERSWAVDLEALSSRSRRDGIQEPNRMVRLFRALQEERERLRHEQARVDARLKLADEMLRRASDLERSVVEERMRVEAERLAAPGARE